MSISVGRYRFCYLCFLWLPLLPLYVLLFDGNDAGGSPQFQDQHLTYMKEIETAKQLPYWR